MRRTWWEFGISAAVLLLVSMSINCALETSGLPGIEPRDDQENAYTCRCECDIEVPNPKEGPEVKQSLTVCAPFELNPNVNPARNGAPLQDFEIIADCQERVGQIYAEMASVCQFSGIVVTCDCKVEQPARFEESCNRTLRGESNRLRMLELRSGGEDPETAATLPLIPDAER